MVDWLIANLWLIPFLPLLGGLLALIGGRWLKGWAHAPVVAGIGLSCVIALILLYSADPSSRTVVYNWIDISAAGLPGEPTLKVPIEFRADGLTTMMLGMVTFVSLLVAIFAAGYMADDPGYPRFFFVFGLFVFSMTGLVLSSNFLLTYGFWEGVGVCSYLLVGFWYSKPSAAAAAKKAFLVNRIGDFGFAVALFLMWMYAPGHDLGYENILSGETIAALGQTELLFGQSALFWIVLLLLWAATAKSAQIPLYVWLPDAMEGPTPVSALIHAATMVTAGVYLLARSSLLLFHVPELQLVVCIIGCLTALLAAAIALTQTDLKRVLAYSTVSQLGFMFMGIGAGVGDLAQFAVIAAVFHLFTHAFFKALLFLGAGSVMHAMGGIIDMRRFRGLRHRLPITCWTFAIGALALSGLPPFAGFWSKDEILASVGKAAGMVESSGYNWGGAYVAIYWIGTLTAFLTAFYTGRAFFLTFFGPEKLPSPDDSEAQFEAAIDPTGRVSPAIGVDTPAPESAELSRYEAAMNIERPAAEQAPPTGREQDPHRPADLPRPSPETTDEPVPQDPHGHGQDTGHHGHESHFGHESPPVMTVPLILLALGAALVGLIFGPITHWFAHHVEATPSFEGIGHAHFGFEWATAITGTLVASAGLALSAWFYARPNPIPGRLAETLGPLYRASYAKFYVDELYGLLIVLPTRLLAQFCRFFDTYVVDGLVRLTAYVPRFVGRDALAPFQNGLIQFYAASTALGVVFLLIVLLLI
ncbi:hypothetical protein BH23PLA1_BH23PLA1_01700 [soil metagenome]